MRAIRIAPEGATRQRHSAVARLVPFEPARQPRKPGGWEGAIWIADDFDAPLPEALQRLFEGGDE